MTTLARSLSRRSAWSTSRKPCSAWGFADIDGYQRMEILKLTMQAEQVEQAQLTNFFLQEAYDIYNARFR